MQKRICTCLPLLLAIVLFGGISNSEPIPQDILNCIGYLTTKKLKDYDIIKNDRWFFHSDNSVDLAIQPLLPRDADFLMIPNSLFVTDNTLSNNKIGLGDDVFYIGLLDYYSGVDHIIPIARFGRIALITN